jgi:3,4-dihydroxyphenylacetate 2,3-dioxygenase
LRVVRKAGKIMGEVVLAAKVTHVPSLMLSERIAPLKGTRDGPINALKTLGKRARERGATAFVIFDTHWISNFGFHINGNAWLRGTYTSPEAPHMISDVSYDYPGNPELADLIAEETGKTGPMALAHRVSTLPVEYGTIVPMHYINGDKAFSVVPVASPIFASVEENRKFGEAVRRAVEKSKLKVGVLASGSLSHQLFENSKLGPEAWNRISSEFNRQMDLRVLDLWREGRYAEFCGMLPDYTRKCNGEALMADTVMLFGALGWDRYTGRAEQLCDYFTSSGSGQVAVEFHLN